MGNKLSFLTTLLILFLFIMPVSVLALPNSDTDKSGNRCEREHSFNYNYNFNYDKELEIGKEYQLELSFSISGSKVTRNPYNVNIELEPNGFELSQNHISLSQGNKIIDITPIKKGASLTVNTKLVLDGDTSQHRGYKATYKDVFTLDQFIISEPKTTSEKAESNNSIKNSTETPLILENKTKTIENKKISQSTSVDSNNKINTNINIETNEPSKVPWYIVRITGIIAFILLSITIIISLLKKINTKKFSNLFKYHKDISILALIFLFLHIVNTLWDKYMWELSLKEIFWFDFSSKISILLSLGVFAFYLLIIITFTSITPKIIQKIKFKRWKYIHLLSYVLFILVIIHSLFLGTDLNLIQNNTITTLILFSIFMAFSLLTILFLIIRFLIKIKGVKK